MTIPASTSGWTYTNIISKVRSITGTPSSDQLTDAQVGAYINNYYVYTMPFELKVQIQQQFLDFKTTAGTNVYAFPGTFLTDQPGAYADGFPLIFYQDPDIFYQDWPQQYNTDSISAGNGVTVTFSGTLQSPPIIIGSLFITDGTHTAQDQGNGTLTGTGIASGTINYTTGAFSVTFSAAPASTTTVYAKYIGYTGNRPQGVLFFNNQFTMMPVPDQVYQIRMQGFINPTGLTSGSDLPSQPEWGPLIAYGAALEIFSDRGDNDNLERYTPMLKRYENVALGRTIQQYTSEQSVPRF